VLWDGKLHELVSNTHPANKKRLMLVFRHFHNLSKFRESVARVDTKDIHCLEAETSGLRHSSPLRNLSGYLRKKQITEGLVLWLELKYRGLLGPANDAET
jgi:hypothetical protein